MIKVEIPGYGLLELQNLLLDMNGTLTVDGEMIHGVTERLNDLSKQLDIYVVTADTFGKAENSLKEVNCKLLILDIYDQQKQKAQLLKEVGASKTVAIGNGMNDILMIERAALGIALIQQEGCVSEAILKARLVFTNINDALDILLNPIRLKAGLRM
jgi:soluble P-type ATPase